MISQSARDSLGKTCRLEKHAGLSSIDQVRLTEINAFHSPG